jgi:hypothetical protein
MTAACDISIRIWDAYIRPAFREILEMFHVPAAEYSALIHPAHVLAARRKTLLARNHLCAVQNILEPLCPGAIASPVRAQLTCLLGLKSFLTWIQQHQLTVAVGNRVQPRSTLHLVADAASWSKSSATNEKVWHTAIEYKTLELGASLSESITLHVKLRSLLLRMNT